jgi:hypothetical protein
MNAKKIITLFLLLFVVASVGTIIAKERSAILVPSAPSQENKTEQTAQKLSDATSPAKVVAYYFHGNFRCATCRKIEALTTEAIQTGFTEDIKNGRVEMRVINIEESGNEHYVQDFQLASRSVVVARYEGGSQKGWKRLDALWQLAGDKDAFIRMVQDETNVLLKGKN